MPFVLAIVFFIAAAAVVVVAARSSVTNRWALMGSIVLAAVLMGVWAVAYFVSNS